MSVVLISRGTMSGVTKLVERLVVCTGWRCISREDLVALVNRHGELAQRIVDRLGRAIQNYDQFCELRRPYVILMRTALLEYACEGDLIYHGYSGHLLVPPIRHFLRVRTNAPLALRLDMTRERLGCSEEDALTYIESDDEQRVRWARFMYGTDIRDPALYDLCINLERVPMDTGARVICALAQDEECQATTASREAAERLLLASQVEAALVSDPRTLDIEAAAQVSDGRVTVTGPYLEEIQMETLREVASGVPGVSEVSYVPGFAPFLGVGS
jgi:cytidylate kinase